MFGPSLTTPASKSPAGPITVFSDAFNETTNTLLTAHTPDLGTGWVLEEDNTAGANSVSVIASQDDIQAAINSNSGRFFYRVNPSPTAANTRQTLLVVNEGPSGTDDPIWLVARWKSFSEYYMAGCWQEFSANGFAIIRKHPSFNSGNPSVIGSYTADDVHDGDTIRFTVNGSNLIMERITAASGPGFVELINVTNTDVAGSGACGIAWGAYGVSTTDDIALLWELDDYLLETLP
jgi:hypothetical protein